MPDQATGNQSGQSSFDGGTQNQGNQGATSGNNSAANGTNSNQNTGQGQQQSARPEYVPESHWDATAGKVKDPKAFGAWINEHVAFKAAEDSKRAQFTAEYPKPDAYKLELPKDFKFPQGAPEFKFADASDPVQGTAITAAREWAHKRGLSQADFSELMSIYAASQVGAEAAVASRAQAERAAMGATAGARVDAIGRWLTATYGDAAAKPFLQTLVTKAQVEVWESIMSKIVSQGAGNFTNGGKEPPPPAGRMAPEEVAKLSPAQRLDYSRRFDQSKMPEWKDPRAA